MSETTFLLLSLFWTVLTVVAVYYIWTRQRTRLLASYEQLLHIERATYRATVTRLGRELVEKVDPWEMQADLMRISGQHRPGKPMLTKTSLLYGALIMEEASETFKALGEVLLNSRSSADSMDDPLDLVISNFVQVAPEMLDYSKRIRDAVAELPVGWSLDLADEPALCLELFDGTTDIAVVNSGFAEACGFPGAAGYRDVAGSNLSKANPDTGVIDKDPSGKWIKGRDYRMPDLAAVLDRAAFDATV